MFIKYSEFDDFFMRKEILNNTKFINCRSIKENKADEKHVICFNKNDEPKMFSEYIIIEESLNGNNFIAMFYDQPEITYQNFYKKLKELDLEGEGNEFSFLYMST